MHYLSMKHLQPGMVLAKPIVGENGFVLLNKNKEITEANFKRIADMGFQGAYIDNPLFDEVEVDDIIDNDLRLDAFTALKEWNIPKVVYVAKKIVDALKYKDVLKLDLLDIKNDKNYIYKHCISVCIFSVVLGMSMEMTKDQLENLAIAGLLHDIGKTEIKKKVLNSKNRFSKADMDEMRKHPMYGYELLRDQPLISSVSRNAILFHHENIDGSGYYEIAEEQIGIFPRILRVADVYDSLTSMKKYRDAQSPAEAIEYLMANAGILFDKNVVEIFTQKFPLYPVGFTIHLSNGESAVVVSNESSALRPKIKLFDGRQIDLGTNADYRSVLIEEFM